MNTISTIICFAASCCVAVGAEYSESVMEELGRKASKGDTTIIDRINEIHSEIYRGIYYHDDQIRLRENLKLMRAAFNEIGDAIKGGSLTDPAFQALLYASTKKNLAPHTAPEFGAAAARGHKPSLYVLLNYKEHGLLLSSAVFALKEPAKAGVKEAIDFLISVVEDGSKKPLWHGASTGLEMAASQGHEGAIAAIQKYEEFKKRNKS